LNWLRWRYFFGIGLRFSQTIRRICDKFFSGFRKKYTVSLQPAFKTLQPSFNDGITHTKWYVRLITHTTWCVRFVLEMFLSWAFVRCQDFEYPVNEMQTLLVDVRCVCMRFNEVFSYQTLWCCFCPLRCKLRSCSYTIRQYFLNYLQQKRGAFFFFLLQI